MVNSGLSKTHFFPDQISFSELLNFHYSKWVLPKYFVQMSWFMIECSYYLLFIVQYKN